MKNIAYIYQPHFQTDCFRVACSDQQGKENYIIVTCSPQYNGVYTYDSSNLNTYDTWRNKKLLCYCVPIDDCKLIKPLADITNQQILNKVVIQQKQWFKNQVTNRNYSYKNKPKWLLF